MQKRLSIHERSFIRSGSIFVWEENATKIRRWTDGKAWSTSRMAGHFQVYRENSSELESFEANDSNSLFKKITSVRTLDNSLFRVVSYYDKLDFSARKLIQINQGQIPRLLGSTIVARLQIPSKLPSVVNDFYIVEKPYVPPASMIPSTLTNCDNNSGYENQSATYNVKNSREFLYLTNPRGLCNIECDGSNDFSSSKIVDQYSDLLSTEKILFYPTPKEFVQSKYLSPASLSISQKKSNLGLINSSSLKPSIQSQKTWQPNCENPVTESAFCSNSSFPNSTKIHSPSSTLLQGNYIDSNVQEILNFENGDNNSNFLDVKNGTKLSEVINVKLSTKSVPPYHLDQSETLGVKASKLILAEEQELNTQFNYPYNLKLKTAFLPPGSVLPLPVPSPRASWRCDADDRIIRMLRKE